MSEASPPNSSGSQDPVSHDKLFKTAFTYFLPDLLALVYPKLAQCLDFSQVKFIGQQLFADFRQPGHLIPDLVAEALTREQDPQLVLIHV
jgi:hypothetical protein